MTPKVELAKPRDFGETINDTFMFVRQNVKPLLKYYFIFCGFFLLATAATSVLSQVTMARTVYNFNPNSFDTDNRFAAFRFLTPTYFLAMFFLLLEYISVTITVLCFMTLYKQKQNNIPSTEEMWGFFKFYFLRILGTSIVIGLLVMVGAVFCIIPGIYLYPIMALVLPIIVMENASLSYAFNHSFQLIKDNWWTTFGVLFVMGIIIYVARMILVMPSAIFTAGSLIMHYSRGTTVSIVAIVITTIVSSFANIFQILMVVATALCYFNLTESKEGTGLNERISQFGTTSTDTNTTPEEY